MGSFQIVERIGPVAHRLTLPREFVGLHDVFHVSILKRYHPNLSYIIPHDETQVQADMMYEELLAKSLSWTDKVLHNKRIPMVKVQWQHHTREEATWKLESDIREKFPNLFMKNLGDQIF